MQKNQKNEISFHEKKSILERLSLSDKRNITDDNITSETTLSVFKSTFMSLLTFNTIFVILLYFYLLAYNIGIPYFQEYREVIIAIGIILGLLILYMYGREITLTNLIQGYSSRKYYKSISSGFLFINTIFLLVLSLFYYFNNTGTGLNDVTTLFINIFQHLMENKNKVIQGGIINSHDLALKVNNTLFYIYLLIYSVSIITYLYLYTNAMRRVSENIEKIKRSGNYANEN